MRSLLIIFVLFFQTTCLAHASAIVEACTNLVHDYAYSRDHDDPDGYANVFAKNGIFLFRGQRFEGRAAIRKRMLDSSGQTTRHVMSNVQVTVETPEKARV
ncbi:MAG: nuclear transport factor 2 family protein, partial [Pseudomonadales bacterium]|nr:nuclear transport factor 2 family protein [Pseudomonadales bacterium]